MIVSKDPSYKLVKDEPNHIFPSTQFAKKKALEEGCKAHRVGKAITQVLIVPRCNPHPNLQSDGGEDDNHAYSICRGISSFLVSR